MDSAASNAAYLNGAGSARLPAFASFIREQHLDEFVLLQLTLARAMQLPLLRFFEGYSEEQLMEFGRAGALDLLEALVNQEQTGFIVGAREQWLNNNLPFLINKEAIAADDIILLSNVRKTALMRFMTGYTTDVHEVQQLHEELDSFFARLNLALTDALTEVLANKIKDEVRTRESEERLRLAVESTQLGTWDYNLVTGGLVVSDRCKQIFGVESRDELSFERFVQQVHDDDRKAVLQMIKDHLAGKNGSHFEMEYRVVRGANGALRWVRVNGEVISQGNDGVARFIGTVLDITDRKAIEERLVESEQNFRQLADSMPQMIWITLADGTVTYFNRKWISYTGITVDTVAESWGKTLHMEDVGRTRKAWQQSLETGETYEIEYRLKHKDTEVYRWFLARALPVKDAEGRITRWIGTCTDIHDQKMAEESLIMQARVLDSMEEGVSIVDDGGFILYTNAAEDRMFGYEEGELIGMHVTVQNAYPKEENRKLVAAVFAELKEKGQWNGEWHNVRKDGTDFYSYSHITKLVIGEKQLFVCVQRDITAEKLAQQALLESEERFRTLADQAPMFVWMGDEEANLTYYNKEIQEYVGGSRNKFLQQGWRLITHPDDAPRLYDEYKKARKQHKPFEVECRLKNAYGQYRWFQFKGVPRFNEGRYMGFIGTGIDIEDQKRLTQELERKVEERTKDLSDSNIKLERSNQELEQFAYVASHDLQEPLRKIKAFGDILVGRYREVLGQEGADLIDRMQSASSRMRTLIEDLLAYSRVSRQPQHKRIELNGLIKEVLLDLETSVKEKKARLAIDDLPVVQGDELQLRQLFQNLLSNGLKFSKEGVVPELSIRCSTVKGVESGLHVSSADQAQTFYAIRVQDNGIGFEPQYAEKIFQVFQRLHGRMEYPGSGVGLSIVQKVVENHNGYVKAESVPGEGASFTILLPVHNQA